MMGLIFRFDTRRREMETIVLTYVIRSNLITANTNAAPEIAALAA